MHQASLMYTVEGKNQDITEKNQLLWLDKKVHNKKTKKWKNLENGQKDIK